MKIIRYSSLHYHFGRQALLVTLSSLKYEGVSKCVLSLFVLITIGIGCSSPKKEKSEESNWVHLTGEAQGTTFSIKYSDENKKEYDKEIKNIFHEIDMQLSTYVDSSVISRLNISKGEFVFDSPMNHYFMSVYVLSEGINTKTNGAFNPLVSQLVSYWGFGKRAETPSEIDSSLINSYLPYLSYDSVIYEFDDATSIIKRNPKIKFDFNAIAQGYTVDVIAEFLESKGIKNYMIEVGGEVLAKGKNDRGESWKLGIDKPTDINAEHKLQAIIELKNRALATSGNYRKFYEKDGIRYSHTIDPKTGYPVQHSLLSATVLAPDCASADAYATAFMVMGVEKTKEFLKNHPELKLDVYLIYSENKNFKTWFSSGLKDIIDEDL